MFVHLITKLSVIAEKRDVWKLKLPDMLLSGCCTNGKLKAVHLSYGI